MKKLRQFYKGFQNGFKDFSHNISLIVNSVLLSIVYVLGVGFTSIFAKLVGKHFLDTNISEDTETYWRDLDLKKKPIEEYYRQFYASCKFQST